MFAWKFAPGLFGGSAPGRDPIIGQRGTNLPENIDVRHGCDDPAAEVEPLNLGEFVTLKGGEYFFAPTRSTLMRL